MFFMGGKAKGGYVQSNQISFNRVTTLDCQSYMTANSGFLTFDLSSDGNTIYAGSHVGGVFLIDITDIENPSVIDYYDTNPVNWNWADCRRILELDSNTLVSCHRSTNPDSGYLRTWDISSGSLLPIGLWDDNVESVINTRYSDMVYDGSKYLYVNGRITSAECFDVSDPTNIIRVDRNLDPDWETHGVVLHRGYAIWANYGANAHNIRATPITAGGTIDNIVDTPSFSADITGVGQKSMRLCKEGDRLYASVIETAGGQPWTEGGLLIYDISDPSQPLPTPVHVPLHNFKGYSSPASPETPQADDPCFNIVKHGDYVYLSNGHQGVAVVKVANPDNPKLKGSFADGIPTDENVKGLCVVERNGQVYCIYGGGPTDNDPNYRTLYIDKVIRS